MSATFTAAAPPSVGEQWDPQLHGGSIESGRYFHSAQGKTRSRSRSHRTRAPSIPYDNGYDSRRSSSDVTEEIIRNGARGSSEDPDEEDDSAWIHRDKLARIESKEMLEAGLKVRHSNARNLPVHNNTGDKGRRRSHAKAGSPPMSINGLIETSGFGFEDADDQFLHGDPYSSATRPNTSRIPVSKNSPVPLPSSQTERDSPLGRTTYNVSGPGTSPDTLGVKKSRPRSQSLGSEQMLKATSVSTPDKPRPVSSHLVDSPLLNESSDSTFAVPPKVRNLKHSPSGQSPASRSGSISKTRSSPNDSPENRPKSRARPHSINRPEGEAPWIATMFKPDPMLPPDQQILPTHAKKLLQEQWARNEKAGDAYDPAVSRPSTAVAGETHRAVSRSHEKLTPITTHLPPRSPPPTSPLPELPGSRQGSLSGAFKTTPLVTPSPSPVLHRDSNTPTNRNSFRAAAERESALSRPPPPVPPKSSLRESGDDGIELHNGSMIHRLDPQKLASKRDSAPPVDEDDGGCCAKCVVM